MPVLISAGRLSTTESGKLAGVEEEEEEEENKGRGRKAKVARRSAVELLILKSECADCSQPQETKVVVTKLQHLLSKPYTWWC